MKAMIFAAGKGTRLQPLTSTKPKALVEVNGKPLLEHVILRLKSFGIEEIIINIHYLGDQILDFLKSKNNFDIRIEISDETKQLLDTGGGLKKASWFFETTDDFIVYNTDILSSIDLNEMLSIHQKSNAIATLAVRNRPSSRYFLFDDDFELCGWKNIKSNQKIITRKCDHLKNLAFSGIHIINPKIFKFMPSKDRFSIVDLYLELSKNDRIKGLEHNDGYWFDIGDLKKLDKADSFFNSR